MKKTYLIAGAIIALATGACTQTQIQQLQQQPTELVPEAETENGEATDTTPAEGEELAEEETISTTDSEHICSELLSCRLGLCPNGRRRKAALAAGKTMKEILAEEQRRAAQLKKKKGNTKDKVEEEENITPSPEQIAAAQKLMEEQEPNQSQKKSKTTSSRNKSTARQATAEVEDAVDTPELVPTTTSGIPGRGGLRRGHFAPPEEAASRGSSSRPRPNAVERHGLRSLSLPSSLPMNINGRTN